MATPCPACFSSKVSPAQILEEYRTTRFPAIFWNTTLGRPYADADSKLTREQVLALCSDEPLLDQSDAACTIGIDVGRRFHVIVSQRTVNRPGSDLGTGSSGSS